MEKLLRGFLLLGAGLSIFIVNSLIHSKQMWKNTTSSFIRNEAKYTFSQGLVRNTIGAGIDHEIRNSLETSIPRDKGIMIDNDKQIILKNEGTIAATHMISQMSRQDGYYTTKQLLSIISDSGNEQYGQQFPAMLSLTDRLGGSYNRVPAIDSFDGFAVIPTQKEDFVAVFGKSPRVVDLSDMTSAQKRLPRGISTTFRHPRNGQEFAERLRMSSSDIFVVIGHNENGMLKIPPQPVQNLELALMADTCSKEKKICILLSCNSDQFVERSGPSLQVHKKLTFKEAADIALETQRMFNVAAQNQISESKAIKALPILISRLERDQHIYSTATVIVPKIGLGGAAGGLLIITSRKSAGTESTADKD